MKIFISRPVANVLVSTEHGQFIVNRNDYNIENKNVYGVGYQIFKNGCYEPGEIGIVLELLSTRKANHGDGVVAIDCGANIGAHTIEWSRHMHGWGNVLAIEAQERIFYMLAGNIALNNCFNARAVWAAVGAAAGEIGVPQPDYFRNASYGSLEIRKTATTENIGQAINYDHEGLSVTRMFAIDDLDLKRLDFIKIDIEGMEIEALQGATQTITRTRPQILIEKLKSDEKQLYKFLLERKYRLYPFDKNIIAIHESDPVSINLNAI